MTVITVGELVELAKLGRRYVEEHSKQGVAAWFGAPPNEERITVAWLGRLPSDEEITVAGIEIAKAIQPGTPFMESEFVVIHRFN